MKGKNLPPCRVEGYERNVCANQVREQRIEGRIDLTGSWSGWKIRGNKIIGSGGVRFTPETLRMAHAGWVKRLPGWDELPTRLASAQPSHLPPLAVLLDQLRLLDDPTNPQPDLFAGAL